MILNPEKLNITEEERKALVEIIKQCVLVYLAANTDSHKRQKP